MTTAPTNQDQVQNWHLEWLNADEPHWGDHIVWHTADEIARRLDQLQAPEPESCEIAERETGGRFYCTRQKGHEGPCAAVEN